MSHALRKSQADDGFEKLKAHKGTGVVLFALITVLVILDVARNENCLAVLGAVRAYQRVR